MYSMLSREPRPNPRGWRCKPQDIRSLLQGFALAVLSTIVGLVPVLTLGAGRVDKADGATTRRTLQPTVRITATTGTRQGGNGLPEPNASKENSARPAKVIERASAIPHRIPPARTDSPLAAEPAKLSPRADSIYVAEKQPSIPKARTNPPVEESRRGLEKQSSIPKARTSPPVEDSRRGLEKQPPAPKARTTGGEADRHETRLKGPPGGGAFEPATSIRSADFEFSTGQEPDVNFQPAGR